jgi:hypothetical protein
MARGDAQEALRLSTNDASSRIAPLAIAMERGRG